MKGTWMSTGHFPSTKCSLGLWHGLEDEEEEGACWGAEVGASLLCLSFCCRSAFMQKYPSPWNASRCHRLLWVLALSVVTVLTSLCDPAKPFCCLLHGRQGQTSNAVRYLGLFLLLQRDSCDWMLRGQSCPDLSMLDFKVSGSLLTSGVQILLSLCFLLAPREVSKDEIKPSSSYWCR